MSLYAIGDLHLSLSADKPMDVFGGRWIDYVKKIEKGFSKVNSDDLTVLCGDLSWAMDLEGSFEDFMFIENLPGKKLVLKGNHDYWWSTATKTRRFFEKYNIKTIDILHNNCYFYNGKAICGTRGWFYEEEIHGESDKKVMNREISRLETSLKAAGDHEKYCFFHYPPIFGGYSCPEILELLKNYGVTRCYYGHIHGPGFKMAVQGETDGVFFQMVSADYAGFEPVKVCD